VEQPTNYGVRHQSKTTKQIDLMNSTQRSWRVRTRLIPRNETEIMTSLQMKKYLVAFRPSKAPQ
jgi:hypothetical protein